MGEGKIKSKTEKEQLRAKAPGASPPVGPLAQAPPIQDDG
jgi:hypothetical protein